MTATLRERLEEALPTASRADRAIASYMLADLPGLPFETAASLAAKVGVSEPTVGRFCRALGYGGFKDLKEHLRRDIGDRPWLIGDRLEALRGRVGAEGGLARGLEREMAALVAVYELAHGPAWEAATRRLARAPTVFATGFQTERGVAQIFVHQLQYLRDGVRLLDLAGGSFAELLAREGDAALVLFEARRYSRLALELARAAREAGVPVTLVTDPYCDWGREVATEVFMVPTAFDLFWESNAQMASLANLLVNGAFLELGPAAEVRMARVSDLHGRFIGHVRGAR
jgi:DNA-binding MurR/RpiR family transcriptional regulator